VLGEIVQALEFGFVGVGCERFAADCYQASDVAIFGFDDCLGSVAALVDSANEVLDWMMVLGGIQAVLHSSADEGGSVQRRRWNGLAECGRGKREWQESQNGSASRLETRRRDGCGLCVHPGQRDRLWEYLFPRILNSMGLHRRWGLRI
jgi:hypothetical protein